MSKNTYTIRTSPNYTKADKLKLISDYNYIIRYQRGGESTDKRDDLEEKVKKGVDEARKGITMFKGMMQKGKDFAKKLDEDPTVRQLKKEALKHSEIKKAYDVAAEIGTHTEKIVNRADELLGPDPKVA